ncbi:dihydrofolate reductase [Rhodoferax koreense]|uniref:Dihydrofolate reductase n=1 Tax=Rhodoferax koreensis TaxID=1842727 RepID=A0A1P8JUG1_9BURK|nr:dihydrofolate reductase [Rhodoferax koreense]APW37383.1 dihydrofolate reductase [Rhodoferax koreense]
MPIHLIFARARNGVIGANNTLPWHLPEDLAHFKRTTMGAPVIMGRKTWDSLPPRFRPLPGRQNVVLTRQAGWQADGAVRAGSVEEARAMFPAGVDAWVIGGADIYAQALPLADSAVVTEIDADFEGDAFAPLLAPPWREVSRETHRAASGLGYSFVVFRRERADAGRTGDT